MSNLRLLEFGLMRLLPSSILVLAAFSLAGCATVPVPATKAPDNPASASAAEGRFERLELFAPAEVPSRPAAAVPPNEAATPAMDYLKMDHSAPEGKPGVADPPADIYTCEMHPRIEEAKPGKCPICRMPLVKKPKEKK